MNKKTKLNFLGGESTVNIYNRQFNNKNLNINKEFALKQSKNKQLALKKYKNKLTRLYLYKVESYSKLLDLELERELNPNIIINNSKYNKLKKNSELNLTEFPSNSQIVSSNFTRHILKDNEKKSIIEMLPIEINNNNPYSVIRDVDEKISNMTRELKEFLNNKNRNKLKKAVQESYNLITELLKKILPTEEVKNDGIKKNSLLQKFFPTPTRINNLSSLFYILVLYE
jgi:hypothetical protein